MGWCRWKIAAMLSLSSFVCLGMSPGSFADWRWMLEVPHGPLLGQTPFISRLKSELHRSIDLASCAVFSGQSDKDNWDHFWKVLCRFDRRVNFKATLGERYDGNLTKKAPIVEPGMHGSAQCELRNKYGYVRSRVFPIVWMYQCILSKLPEDFRQSAEVTVQESGHQELKPYDLLEPSAQTSLMKFISQNGIKVSWFLASVYTNLLNLEITWRHIVSGDDAISEAKIQETNKFAISEEGSLYILNTRPSDARTGRSAYSFCHVTKVGATSGLRRVRVTSSDSPISHQTKLLYKSKDKLHVRARSNTEASLQCIFQNVPSNESIRWIRQIESGSKVKLEHGLKYELTNLNRLLRIKDVTQDDDGLYECSAGGVMGQMKLTVEYEPIWSGLTLGDEEDAVGANHVDVVAAGLPYRMHCITSQHPATTKTTWELNGSELPSRWMRNYDSQVVSTDKLTLADMGTVKCSAFNDNGHKNAYKALTVLQPVNMSYSIQDKRDVVTLRTDANETQLFVLQAFVTYDTLLKQFITQEWYKDDALIDWGKSPWLRYMSVDSSEPIAETQRSISKTTHMVVFLIPKGMGNDSMERIMGAYTLMIQTFDSKLPDHFPPKNITVNVKQKISVESIPPLSDSEPKVAKPMARSTRQETKGASFPWWILILVGCGVCLLSACAFAYVYVKRHLRELNEEASDADRQESSRL